ncbi:hypothetical protein NEOLEDRAFT_1180377 [Neolentinus lepideus HHB14362 ss-1]|uniref:Fungal lipase-type domain-containing protein n=1 Tax=Neolentinus lepideus HHB14362 ss-1 TaxID=1314782 RepID=A0A165R188_9AGAM|nr:hypothetical protein NEOLEDRAFT_1180377 [Neolentinus lepideus HHB14362 ss-1]
MTALNSLEIRYTRLRSELLLQHVRQLSQIPDNYKLDTDFPSGPWDPDRISVQILKEWTRQAQQQFEKAVAQQVFGQKGTISWENAVVTFLESAAMYLRDTTMVTAAIKEAKEGNVEKAIEYLEKSDAEIKEIAEFWGFDYVTICDLIDTAPDGHCFVVGPFCGAFSNKDKKKPFIGIAFKGTTRLRELLTDIDREPMETGSTSILWDTKVSKGPFSGLFGTYGDWGAPMDHIVVFIQKSTSLLPEGSPQLISHSTGHSLGASYGTLCHAQLLLYYSTKPVEWVPGDLYTYGSPRIGENSFSLQLQTALKSAPGSTWRIVNQNDTIAVLVPVPRHLIGFLPAQDDQRIYIHADTAYRISNTACPVLMNSEIGQDPGPAPMTPDYLRDPQHIADHFTPQYWPALLVANGIRIYV